MDYKPMSPYEKCVRVIHSKFIDTSLSHMNTEQMHKMLNDILDKTEATINYCELLGIE